MARLQKQISRFQILHNRANHLLNSKAFFPKNLVHKTRILNIIFYFQSVNSSKYFP